MLSKSLILPLKVDELDELDMRNVKSAETTSEILVTADERTRYEQYKPSVEGVCQDKNKVANISAYRTNEEKSTIGLMKSCQMHTGEKMNWYRFSKALLQLMTI